MADLRLVRALRHLVLVLVPSPDCAVVAKNTLTAGRTRGSWASAGMASSNAVQGVAAAVGLGALIVASQPVFDAIKWAGVGYLAFLGLQALRSAWRGGPAPAQSDGPVAGRDAVQGWRQVSRAAALALTHAVLSLTYLTLPVRGLHRARRLLGRRAVRHGLDATTGVVLPGLSARLAGEHA